MALRDFRPFDNHEPETLAVAHVRQANFRMAYSF
jgi:hypothetical protein